MSVKPHLKGLTMNNADRALVELARAALEAGKSVIIGIRHLPGTPVLTIEEASMDGLVTFSCPGNEDFGIGTSRLTLRVGDLVGVQILD